jgi:hypothetical protein
MTGSNQNQRKLGAAKDIHKLFADILYYYRAYSPEISALTFNYMYRSWQAKLVLNIEKSGVSIQLPKSLGASLIEILEGKSLHLLNYHENDTIYKFQTKISGLHRITLDGLVPSDFFKKVVDIRSSADTTSNSDVDKYWLNAALRDAEMLQKFHDEFIVDRITPSIKVGIARIFTTSVPPILRRRLQAQRKLLSAIESGRREVRVLSVKYRRIARESRLQPYQILDTASSLVDGDYFRGFLVLEGPFQLGAVYPDYQFEILPERVSVQVYTKLNLEQPTADGYLTFLKREYSKSVADKYSELLKKEKVKKKKRKSNKT